MTRSEVATLVDRGLEIIATKKKLDAEFKEIEAQLEAEGYEANKDGKVADLKDADREGRRWLARGSKLLVPVVFTADKIVGSFTRGTDLHAAIQLASDGKLLKFFKPVDGYKSRFDDGKKFRAQAAELLEKKAPEFITACLARDKQGTPISDVKFLWNDPEVVL